jgi:putative N6-adenine-specific DNA methylase
MARRRSHCTANLAAAGVAGAVVVERVDALTHRPAPAGHRQQSAVRSRLARSALAALYPRLGDALKQRFAGWTAYLFSGDTRLAKLIGLKASRRTPLYNGALECRLYEYRLVAGALRQARQRRTRNDRMNIVRSAQSPETGQ